ncbi:MAG: DASS family sodium-coupled anion symporter [Mariprofundaceae bacterium]|nr:DASS family sodium-coupled anion symporter [Mariprofundaceae bacterium]
MHLFDNPGRTKLALATLGVALPKGLGKATRWVAQSNAIETVIDLRLPSGHFCTVPIALPYTQASPISLIPTSAEGCASLLHEGEQLDVQLLPAPMYYSQKTRLGHRMGQFSSLHENLLLLHPVMGCDFFMTPNMSCQYCQYDALMGNAIPTLRDPLELVEVVHAALVEREIETVYLYHGFSNNESDAGLKSLVAVIALLRRHLGHRQIALETVAPQDCSVIDELYAAGLDVFICNLEVADAQRFAEVCPGKQLRGGQAAVWQALEHARHVFRAGAVVSHLIAGLESVDSTKKGMEALVKKGIVPLLLPFRPLPDTPLSNRASPSLINMETLLLHQYALLHAVNFPTHRLRHMGRVMTPMESRVLDGSPASLGKRFVEIDLVRKAEGWFDMLRRHLRVQVQGDGQSKVVNQHKTTGQLMVQQARPFVMLSLLFLAMWMFTTWPPPTGLTLAAWHALLVFGLCLVLWVSQLLPLSVTSLLGIALLPILGVMPTAEVFALFGNPAVFFILGAFMLAAGVIKTGLSEHVALMLLHRMGGDSRQLLMAMLLLPALMAFVMPEHAVAAVFLPIVWSVVRSLNLSQGDRYAQALFFAVAWGAIIGGVMTLLGGARGPLALALLGELTGTTFSFAQWTLAGFPLVLMMLVVAAVQLYWMQRGTLIDMSVAKHAISQRMLELGVMTVPARAMAVLLLFTILTWVFAGHALGLANIALLAVVIMFAMRLVSWNDVETHVNWGVLLMYGGAIAVGKALSDTGAGLWLAHTILPEQMSVPMLLLLLTVLTLLLTECVSNAAAVAILLPIALPLGMSMDVSPIMIALLIGIVSGFAFMLPMGTPPNAMIFASGFVHPQAMLRYGSMMSLTAATLFLLVAFVWWPYLHWLE